MNRKVFFNIYWKLQSVIAPGLKYSQAIYEDVLRENIGESYKWLDLGCGHHLLAPWRIDEEEKKSLTKPNL